MKKYMLILLLLTNFSFCSAQDSAKIFITLEDTKLFTLEKVPTDVNNNLKIVKIDDWQYDVTYSGKLPGIIMLNYKQLYVMPSDNAWVTYKLIMSDNADMIDTLFEKQKKGNYTFSNYGKLRNLDRYYPNFDHIKYKNNIKSFYKDLVDYNFIYDKFYDSLYKKSNCDTSLIGFKRREHNLSSLFNLFYYEKALINSNSLQSKILSGIIDTAFLQTEFYPPDNKLTLLLQRLIKTQLSRLIDIKYNKLRNLVDINNLIVFINQYQNKYVSQYFAYFLRADYKEEMLKIPKDNKVVLNINKDYPDPVLK